MSIPFRLVIYDMLLAVLDSPSWPSINLQGQFLWLLLLLLGPQVLVSHFPILILISVNIILCDQLCHHIFFCVQGLLVFINNILCEKYWVRGVICIKLGLECL